MSSSGTFAISVPAPPESVASCGIPAAVLEDLLLKHLYLPGVCTRDQLAHSIRLPDVVVGELVQSLHATQDLVADPNSERVALTLSGRRRANDAFEMSRYLGPAPVSLTDYQEQCQRQAWNGCGVSEDDLQAAMSGVSLNEAMISDLRVAIACGRSLLLTGRSGNGKSLIASRLGQMLEQSSELVCVPYAVWLNDGVLRIFDPATHHVVEEKEVATASQDRRWRPIRRPFIRTSLQLTLDLFEASSSAAGVWLAPFHVRANGGMLLIDDLGRQSAPLVDLMNRWLEPLEQQSDRVMLPNGRRLTLPVDAWIILVASDDAPRLPVPVARRIRSQIHLPDPDRDRFASLLLDQGRKLRIDVDEAGVEQLFSECYSPQNPPKCSDPENLLQTVESLCRIQKETVRARADLLLAAAQRLGLDQERRAA